MGHPSGSLTETSGNFRAKFHPANFPPFIQFGNPDCREINACSSGKGGQHELLPTHLRAFSLSPLFDSLILFHAVREMQPIPSSEFFRLPLKSQQCLWILQISLQSMSLQRLADQSEKDFLVSEREWEAWAKSSNYSQGSSYQEYFKSRKWPVINK